MHLIMSKAEDDEIERIMRGATETPGDPALPPVTLSGTARRQIADAIKTSIAAHQRGEAGTKVRFEQQRHRTARQGLEQVLRLVWDRDAEVATGGGRA